MVVAFPGSGGLTGLGQIMIGVAVSNCHIQGLSCPCAGLGASCLLCYELSVTHIDLTGALSPTVLSTTVPQDLMDVSVSNLPPLWQPSPRKSSCSPCSQSGLADGGSSNGCNHERYEGLNLWVEGVEGFAKDL